MDCLGQAYALIDLLLIVTDDGSIQLHFKKIESTKTRDLVQCLWNQSGKSSNWVRIWSVFFNIFVRISHFLVFIFLPLTNGIREGKALSGVKAPLGLAHVKKRKDKKSFRKACWISSIPYLSLGICYMMYTIFLQWLQGAQMWSKCQEICVSVRLSFLLILARAVGVAVGHC